MFWRSVSSPTTGPSEAGPRLTLGRRGPCVGGQNVRLALVGIDDQSYSEGIVFDLAGYYGKPHLLLRFAIAALSLHLSACLLIFLTGGFLFAMLLLFGRSYVQIFALVMTNPILQISAASAALAFFVVLLWPSLRRVSAVWVGPISIIIFFLAGEVTSRTAMQIARKAHGAETCLFGVRLFTGSAMSATARGGLFNRGRVHHHHAHISLQNGTVLNWSYEELDFEEMSPGAAKFQRIPKRCNP
ncbi:MAG: hypothetical protein KUG69_03445 [Marinosulfonomonas sp.]|nr:hypothetical protein [Marinosulfonomonas sp.]